MRRSARLPDPRPGFTLVELMVAMALIILIMAILSFAFQVGMDTLSQLKSIGGLSEQLRTAEATLRRDLEANHLEDPTGSPVGVSNALSANPTAALPWTGLNRGYFAVTQRSMGYKEGFDSEITSWRGDSEGPQAPGYHILRMTVQLSGQTAQETFSAKAPPGVPAQAGSLSSFATDPDTLVSRWAEVVYFIRPNGLLTASNDPTVPPMPMYTLYRRQQVLAASNFPAIPKNVADPAQFPDLSWSRVNAPNDPPQNRINTPTDVTDPINRLGGRFDPSTLDPSSPANNTAWPTTAPDAPTPAWPAVGYTGNPIPFPYRIPASTLHARFGSDVVLNNVVSFQVQTITDPPLPVAGATSPYQWGPAPPPLAGGTGPNRPWTFDTAETPPQFVELTPGNPATRVNVRLRAVQVKVRVYDAKNHQTRQITLVQDL